MQLDLFVSEDGYVECDSFMYCLSCENYVECYVSATDYGSHVFVDCSKCTGLFVVDCLQESDNGFQWEEIEDLIKVYPPSDRKVESINGHKIEYSIKVPLLYIEKVVGSNFCNVMLKSTTMSEEEIRKIYENFGDNPDELCSSNFFVLDSNIFETGDTKERKENIKRMLYVTCNSYDISKPEIEYPKNLDLSHDGNAVMFMYDGGKIGYISGD